MVYNEELERRIKKIVSRWQGTDDKKMFGKKTARWNPLFSDCDRFKSQLRINPARAIRARC
jgi:hypothetical protein